MAQQEIMFHNTAGLSFKNRKLLKTFLIQQARREGKVIQSLVYVFSTKREIVNINKQFLSHDYPTDIITFDLSNPPKKIISAEIYICADVIKKNAKEYGTTWTSELHRVIFHGLLHLCGYNDKTVSQQNKMREKENEWLEKYFVSRGT
jgi:rRNA maturation RNase YbeY